MFKKHINLVNFFSAVTISVMTVCMVGANTTALAEDTLSEIIRALSGAAPTEPQVVPSPSGGDTSAVDVSTDKPAGDSQPPSEEGGISEKGDYTLDRSVIADVEVPDETAVSIINALNDNNTSQDGVVVEIGNMEKGDDDNSVLNEEKTTSDSIFDWLLWLIGIVAIILIVLFCRRCWESRKELEYDQLGKSLSSAPEGPSLDPSSNKDAQESNIQSDVSSSEVAQDSDQKKDGPVSAVAENVIESDAHPSSKQDVPTTTDTEESDQKKDEPVSAVVENVIESDAHPSSKQDVPTTTDTEESDQKKDEPVSAVVENVIESDAHPSSKQDVPTTTDTEESDQKKDKPVSSDTVQTTR